MEADCPEAEESEAPLTFHEKIKDEVLAQGELLSIRTVASLVKQKNKIGHPQSWMFSNRFSTEFF